MMGFIPPIILVALSIGAFVWYIDPTYTEVRALQENIAKYDEALTRVSELRDIRKELEKKRNDIGDDKEMLLNKFLPNNLDSVRLALDLDAIAKTYGMRLAGLQISEPLPQAAPGEITAGETRTYRSIDIGFSVKGSYEVLRQFIRALEASLRLVDIHSISFGEEKDGLYDFKINLTTYWLK